MISILKIYFLVMISALIFTGPHTSSDSVLQITTGTPTAGLSTQTPTRTPANPSQTFTPSVTPPRTPTIPSYTHTPSTTPTATPTTTLMPLPEITLIFPESTSTSTTTTTPRISSETPTSELPGGSELQSVYPRYSVLTVVIVILWLILAGFLIVYVRQFK